MAEKIIIAELDIDVKALISSTTEVKKSMDSLKKEQKELAKNGQDNSEQFVENAANLKLLNSEYNAGIKAIAGNSKAIADQTNRTDLLSLALNKEVSTIAEAREQNKLLNKLRNETNATTAEGQAEIKKLNSALDSNNAFIKDNADAYLKQKINIGNYSSALQGLDGVLANFGINGEQARTVVSGFTSTVSKAGNDVVNFSNSAIKATASTLGFKTATQLAAQTQVIQTTATEAQTVANAGLATTTVGVTAATTASTLGLKAFTVALASTGIGLIVIALGALFAYLKDLDPLLDKIEQGFAAVGAVVRVLGKAIASLSFDGLGDSMNRAAKEAVALKEAQQDLADLQNSQEVANAKASQQYDELILKSKNRTLTEKERVSFLQQAEKIEEANYKQRSALSQKELDQAIESARIKGQLSNQELDNLEKNTLAYGTYLLNTGKITQSELDALKKAELGKIEIDSESTKRLEKNQNAQDRLQDDAKAKSEKIEADKLVAQKKRQEDAAKIIDAAIEKNKQELDLFIESQGIKAKSLAEDLDIARQVLDKRLEILKAELANKKITQTQFDLESLRAKNDFLKQEADIVVENAQIELNNFIAKNKTTLDQKKFLSDQLVSEEITRLALIADEQNKFEETRLAEGITNKQAHDDAIKAIDATTAEQQKVLLEQKDAADLEKNQIDLDNKLAANQSDLDLQIAQLEAKRLVEVTAAEKTGADVSLINKKYAKAEVDIKKIAENAKLEAVSNTLSQAASLFKEHTLAYKAISIAQVVIDTYKSATSAFAGMVSTFPGPIGIAAGVVAAGVAVASGVANVAKISGVKFEKGGIQEVGGNRHAQGGTKFYGEDGTTFEAEKGEGIGVLNRGAFASFMDFNNNHSSGGKSTPTFMAGGGIITQGVSSSANTGISQDMLMDAIANMPAPIVTVQDINYQTGQVVRVVSGADF
jgi:hypothetical protein